MSRILLICFVSPKIGLGHLSRMLTLASSLNDKRDIIPEFLIFGELVKKNELTKYKVHNFPLENNFVNTIEIILNQANFNALVFDLYKNCKIKKLGLLFKKLKKIEIFTVAIDSLIEHCNILDLIWIPSFYFDCSKYQDCNSIIKSGWDSFLIDKRLNHKSWKPGLKVLILTGGSDLANLGQTLPNQLDQSLADGTEINWVKGPFSKKPNLPNKCRLNWVIHDAPEHLDELIVNSNYVISVFGVSFFEVLQYGIPTVVFSPYKKDNQELNVLSKENVALVADNIEESISGLTKLMNNEKISKKYSVNALKKMSSRGTDKLSNKILSHIKCK